MLFDGGGIQRLLIPRRSHERPTNGESARESKKYTDK